MKAPGVSPRGLFLCDKEDATVPKVATARVFAVVDDPIVRADVRLILEDADTRCVLMTAKGARPWSLL
jgi:hypothetical protein